MALAVSVGSGYFTVMSLFDPGGLVPGGDSPAARTYASYLVVRSVVLLGAALWFTAARSWRPLALVLGLNGAVQSLDAALGVVHHSVANTLGPAIFAVGLFAAAALLRRGQLAALRSAAYPRTSGAPSRAASAVWSSGIRCDCRSAATRAR